MSSFPRTEITFLKAAKIQNGKKEGLWSVFGHVNGDCACLTEDCYVSDCFCSLSRPNCVLCFRFFSAVQGMISLSCSQNNDRKPQDRDLRKSRAAHNLMACNVI